MQPSPTDAFIKTLDDESLEFLHDYLLGKLFPRPEKHGMVTITGFGRCQRQPVTFYSTWDLDEDYASTWEVFAWLHDHSPQPSVQEILDGNMPVAPPAAPIPSDCSSIMDRRPVRACRKKTGAFMVSPSDPVTPRPPRRKVLLGVHGSFEGTAAPPRTWSVPHLCPRTTRTIFKARQTIFQGGVRIPNSDAEAEQSPEWRQWAAGLALEHVRLTKVGAFKKGLSLSMVLKTGYPKSGIVLMQHARAFKHSGEFRARAVARGDRQHPSTVTLTFAPTASMLTVRLFYLITIEESHAVINGDVPQAFLQGAQDVPLFLWAPKSQRTFPGEIYQALLPLSPHSSKRHNSLWR
jgi:hypothetical protein